MASLRTHGGQRSQQFVPTVFVAGDDVVNQQHQQQQRSKATWDIILDTLFPDDVSNEDGEEETRVIKRRCVYERNDWSKCGWAVELKELEEEGTDPTSRSSRRFRRDFRIPYPFFLELVALVKERGWFPTAQKDACGRPCIPTEHKVRLESCWYVEKIYEFRSMCDTV